MRYRSTVLLEDNIEKLWKILEPEAGKKDRSGIRMTKGKKLSITITAVDYTAFKASMNQILKALEVIEKVSDL